MLTRFVYIIFFSFITCVALAQKPATTPQRTPEQEAAKQTDMLTRVLPDLSDVQKQQLYDINLKYIKERAKHPERNAAIERLKRKQADYQNILTETQFEILQKSCEHHRTHCPSAYSSHAPSVPMHTTQY